VEEETEVVEEVVEEVVKETPAPASSNFAWSGNSGSTPLA
jgi:hypothetical protein